MEFALWTEKYRPKTFAEIRGQQEIVKRVQALVEQRNIPHLLFTGPAGVGKTTLALVVCKSLFGESWRENLLELNASYAQTTRFILSANYASKIIDPIQSRCAVFRFKPLPQEELLPLIEKIIKEEHLKIDKSAEQALYEVCGGDCRKAENILQSCAAMSKTITAELIHAMASVARPKEVKEILETAIKGDFIAARKKLLDTMLRYGLSGHDMVKQIQKEIIQLTLEGRKKASLIEACGEIEFRISEGSDEFVQLEALLARFALL